MSDSEVGPAGSAGGGVTARIAAVVTGLQVVVLLGFAARYLWGLARGESDDPVRVVVSVVLMLAFAAALALLARALRAGRNRARAPTVVWNLLLVPVSWSLVQAGVVLVGSVVLVTSLAAVLSAVAMGRAAPSG